MPATREYVESALSVIPSDTILLDRYDFCIEVMAFGYVFD